MEDVNTLLKLAMKNKETLKTKVYRGIKSEFILYQTSKNAKPLDESAKVAIINKMIKQRKESAEQYKNANRPELCNNELAEIEVLEQLLPKAATEADIKNTIMNIMKENHWITPCECSIPKKSMGLVIKEAKARLINVDGKLLSNIVKEYVDD